MNLTKNQIYIISSIVILVVAYYLFFRKKPAKPMAKIMMPSTPPSTPATPAESGWAGQWDYTPEMEMAALSGTFDPYAKESGYAKGSQFASSYTGSQIESGYDGIAPAQVPPASSVLSLGTDWLVNPNKSSDFIQQEMGFTAAQAGIPTFMKNWNRTERF